MKIKLTLFSAIILIMNSLTAQNLEGSWRMVVQDGEPVSDKEIIAIYQDGYYAIGAKEIAGDAFLYAEGGEYAITKSEYSQTADFHTKTPERIGVTENFSYTVSGDTLKLQSMTSSATWVRILSTSDALTRNWVITGRERDGKMNTMTPGDRRTVKILSGGRFQWIAFNSATKEFSGTGGGTYTAKDGIYTETITFFSRDNSRVDANLQFTFEVKEGAWHHKGKSSAGDPIYEIWSPYEEAYKKP